ncbi:hypothetical protein BX616_004040 [Lobosporangium transversale]|nr:hypothetical protein BX616_004040 [Lobosporangium transversale]
MLLSSSHRSLSHKAVANSSSNSSLKRLSSRSKSRSSVFSRNHKRSFRTTAALPLFLILFSLLLISSLVPQASAAPLQPGFCPDCQTFALAIKPCGGTFEPKDIEINGMYNPPQSVAKCACSDIMQKVLWTCARCELLAGFTNAKTPPPQMYQTQCMSWGITIDAWRAPYTGDVVAGTNTAPLNGEGGVPANPVPTSNPANPPGGSGNGGGSGSNPPSGTSAAVPTNSNGSPVEPSESEGGGPNGTAIGISLGIIGVAAVGGAAAVIMMKRSRRRHEPLELDDTYVGMDHQWEKPARSQSPSMPPAGPMHRPSPFESRPGGSSGGSVVGGYDPQYDNYDHHGHPGGNNYEYGHHQAAPGYDGYDGYNNGGYQQGYAGHGQEYGYEHAVPTSGPFQGAKPSEKGQYL